MRYVCVKQHDSKDCGVACLASICKTYGLSLPLVKFKELTKSDNMGTNILGLVEAGNELGFETDALKGTIEELREEITQKNVVLPLIAHVIINDNFEHFVVVHKIEGDKVILADPASGIVKKDLTEFLQEWTGNIVSFKKTDKFISGKKNSGLVSFFINNMPSKKKIISLIILFSIGSSLIGIITSMVYSMVIDGIVLGNFQAVPGDIERTLRQINPLRLLAAIAGGAAIMETLKLLFDILRGNLVARLSVVFDTAIIEKYYEHLLNLPAGFFSTKKTGELISRFNDAIKIRTALMSLLLSVTLDLIMVIVGGILLFVLSSRLFLISFASIIALLTVMYFFKDKIEQLEKKVMHSNGLVTSFLKETVSGIETIKLFQLESTTLSSFRNIWEENQKASCKGSMTDNKRMSLVDFISSTGVLCLYALGVLEILNGNLSIGLLISYTTLSGYFLTPFTNIVNLQTEVQSASVALDRLGDVLYANREAKEEGKVIPHLLEDIHFEQVSFSYGNRKPVLNELTFTIRKNELTSIIGESGSGKTTIAKLLLHLFDKNSGNIKIGATAIEDISIDLLRQKIAMVSQDSFFFNESIIKNLRKGNEQATEEEIAAVCQACGIHSFIMELPLQYDSILEEGGNNLSGGQKQLLSIARALLKKPDILILDEATSNLDSHSEEIVSKIISQMEITCIVIAHRLKTIINSQQIILLKDGHVDGQGTHELLLEESKLYYEMISKQKIV